MREVIIASHHRFAQGLADTLTFLGAKNKFHILCTYTDDNDQIPLGEQVKELFNVLNDSEEILILTDILQGSVNQAFYPYMNEHCFLVTGVNVALALELCLESKPLSNEIIQRHILNTVSSIKLVNLLATEDSEDDE